MTHAVLFTVRGERERYYSDAAGTQEAAATPDSLAGDGYFEVADEPVSDPHHPEVVRRLTYARIDASGEEPVAHGVG